MIHSLVRPDVALEVDAPLRAIARSLLDDHLAIDQPTLDRIEWLLADGGTSPLFGRSAADARRAVTALDRALSSPE